MLAKLVKIPRFCLILSFVLIRFSMIDQIIDYNLKGTLLKVSMKKILFLHGFYASGQCVPALALRESFEGRAEVITPDLPMHPKEAARFIRGLIDREKPDLLIGNSCGSFYAQMVASVVGVPALLGNPHFMMTEFLKQRLASINTSHLERTVGKTSS